VALIGLVFLLPIFIGLSILIAYKLGWPVVFAQQRPGLHSKIFKMIKFRTMTDECDLHGTLLPDAQRLTPFGCWLRSTSLDELPELWNVLCGNMSLVGPRPLLIEYLPIYSLEQARRHEVRPGITGWAQVNGRNAISWQKKFELDVWYVDSHSFLLDLKIIWITIGKVLSRSDVKAGGGEEVEFFNGRN